MHQSILAAPRFSPPPGGGRGATAGHLLALSVPGVGDLRYPGDGHLPTPGRFPSFSHACGVLSEYNYKEDFTRKTSILALL